MKTLKRIIDLILPPRCLSCGDICLENSKLCPPCWKEIRFISDPQCSICGWPLPYQDSLGMVCIHCAQKKPLFTMARSVMVYDKASSGIILKLKHGDATYLAPALGEWMWSRSGDLLKDIDYLIPVPLHWFRLFMRRYNQAAILAKVISEKSFLPVRPHLLRRQRFTKSQAHLNRQQRQRNVKKAFYVPSKQISFLQNKKIALVDDVFTTGATINECVRILLKAGCSEVRVITLARVVVKG